MWPFLIEKSKHNIWQYRHNKHNRIRIKDESGFQTSTIFRFPVDNVFARYDCSYIRRFSVRKQYIPDTLQSRSYGNNNNNNNSDSNMFYISGIKLNKGYNYPKICASQHGQLCNIDVGKVISTITREKGRLLLFLLAPHLQKSFRAHPRT